jgi:hypothetical protein
VLGLDSGKCKAGTKPDMVLKYVKMLSKEWQDDKGTFYCHLVYPDYHEWSDNILQLSDLRKFKFANPSTPSNSKQAKNKSEVEEIKALIELRKTSGVFKRAAAQKM